MLWFFQNGAHVVRIETHYDRIVGECVAIVHWPDGLRQEERFGDVEAFRCRLAAIEQELLGRRYRLDGCPTILTESWLRRNDRSS